MGLAALYNVPTVTHELDSWTFFHMVHHRDVNERIFLLANIRIDEYVLDPVDPLNNGNWEVQHQAMHQAVNSVLGLGSGFDLSEVDFKDPTKLSGWIFQNGIEHRQWSDILGVG